MNVIENDKKLEKINLELTHAELRKIFSAIGELSFGVHIEEFEFYARLGCTKNEMGKLAECMREIIDENHIEL